MSSVIITGNHAHDATASSALSTLQSEVAAATTQKASNTAYIKYYRAVLASCVSNNNGAGAGTCEDALRELGVYG